MKKILLVEDNELNRDMLSRRLSRKGYNVICAIDGQEAVTLSDSEEPDLILMDMSLPVIDGWAATRMIREKSNTPIIALTAHAMAEDRQKALDAGCSDYDTKPIDFNRLNQKMLTLLESPVTCTTEE